MVIHYSTNSIYTMLSTTDSSAKAATIIKGTTSRFVLPAVSLLSIKLKES